MSEDTKILCPDDCANFDESKLREVGFLGQCTDTDIGILKKKKKHCLGFAGKKLEKKKIEVVVPSD